MTVPFYSYGEDGETYIHYDNWLRWRYERCEEYPAEPLRSKWRFDIEISHPRRILTEIPVDHDPHSFLSPHHYFYHRNCWSTIFGAHPAWIDGGMGYRMLIESCNPDPVWGERLAFISTSSWIVDIPWETNPPNKFVYFRGFYWKVSYNEFLHPFHEATGFNTFNWPLRNNSNLMLNNTFLMLNNTFLQTAPFIWDEVGDEGILGFDDGLPRTNKKINWVKEGF